MSATGTITAKELQSRCDRLTPRQKEIFDMISRYIATHGFSPAVRDISAATGISSPNGILGHLKALEKKGLITRNPTLARSIQIVKSIDESHRTYEGTLSLFRHPDLGLCPSIISEDGKDTSFLVGTRVRITVLSNVTAKG